jgi:proprotein convertase subtilisin/kexin type 5
LSECDLGTYANELTNTCDDCHVDCATCNGPESTDCLSCDGLYLESGTCIHKCTQVGYYEDDSEWKCKTC